MSLAKIVSILLAAGFLFTALIFYLDAGLNTNLPDHAGDPYLVSVLGSLSASASPGLGNLTITVDNTDSAPITGIYVMNSSDLPQANNLLFLYDGTPVGPSNPLPVGKTVAGTTLVPNVTSGVAYSMVLTIEIRNYGPETLTLDITARA
jgi:hypothetical protein